MLQLVFKILAAGVYYLVSSRTAALIELFAPHHSIFNVWFPLNALDLVAAIEEGTAMKIACRSFKGSHTKGRIWRFVAGVPAQPAVAKK